VADDHCFRHCDSEWDGNDVGRGNLKLSSAATHCTVGGKQGAAGDIAGPGDDQDLAVTVLVAAFSWRQRVGIEEGAV
jgi:hypothetical protein